MKTCAVDIETYSSVKIDHGVYAYVESADFEILLVAYQMGDQPVKSFMPRRFAEHCRAAEGETIALIEPELVELTGSEDEFLKVLADPGTLKTAYNANFERTCLAAYYGVDCDPDQWRCTAVLAATLGLPRSLEKVGEVLDLKEDAKKLKTGKELIRYFCQPVPPTRSNGGRTRNYPRHDPERWRLFCEYNLQDVTAEQAIRKRLARYAPNTFEQRLWSVDQQICDRGIRVDRPFVEGIVDYDAGRQDQLMDEARQITGLQNPNSLVQLKQWLTEHGAGDITDALSKDTVADALKAGGHTKDVERVLQIRQALGKTSIKKYTAILNSVCRDDHVRGMLLFYGSRTGRWAGRIVQLQNLPQNHLPDLDTARKLVAARDFDGLEMLYGEPAPVFSELIRTAFIPENGNRFVVTDFSAIEARVIAWLAGEDWRLDVFRNGGDIYCASASQMFKVPVEKHGVNGHLRQQGKVAELALGYGGAEGAIKAMDKAGAIPESEIAGIVSRWRAASPGIVKLWRDYEDAALKAIREHKKVKRGVRIGTYRDYSDREYAAQGPVRPYSVREGVYVEFAYRDSCLFVKLPSGRRIAYWNAREGKNRFGRPAVLYDGVGQTTQWGELETFGGRLVENVVQATARDCLAVKMVEASRLGYKIVAHVHDEMILDVPKTDTDAAARIDQLMAEPIPWAPGLPLKGSTYECAYYMKD